MSSNSLSVTNNKTETINKRRSHSNTISGGPPPALDINITRPPNVRRNSEGSPQLPPPICVSEPTPIEPSNRDEFFGDNKSVTSSVNSSRPNTPNSDISTPPAPLPKGFATAPVGGLLSSPKAKKKGRSRASSLTSNLINEIKESSTIQNIASKIKSRHSTDEMEERTSFDGADSSVSGSVTNASGVSLAVSKKNEDFHALFRSVPEDDNLIEDFGCALQKEILLQGRIYISESYICFNANIFGWVTNLVIAFEDIIDIEKKSTAYFIPNAIQISTDSSKHFFASFLSRDQAFDLMVDIWHNARPDLVPAKDGENIESADSCDSYDDESGSSYESDTEDSYSDDSGDEASLTNDAEPVVVSTPNSTSRSRKASVNATPVKDSNVTSTAAAAARRRATSELPRPKAGLTDEKTASDTKAETAESATEKAQVNEKTTCECESNGGHYPNTVMDQVYNGTLEKIFKLFYETSFMKTFLLDNQKSTELSIGEWKKGEGEIVSVRDKSYIKALGGSIGPKSTKCICTEEILHKDFDNYVTVLTTTCTPDVPSGGSFSCKTKTCMTWAGKGKVRIFVTVLVDFTKSSWLKSTIEKASIDGQTTYYKELDAVLRAHAKENPADFGDTAGNGSGGKSESRRRKKGKRSKNKREPKAEVAEVKKEEPQSAVHRVLGSISNMIADIITGVIDAICSPKASHLTLLCLITMVLLNIFIARKMAYVEQQLNTFGQQQSDIFIPTEEASSMPKDQLRRQYNRQEEEDLWEWLGHVDPDKSSPMKEKVTFSSSGNSKEQEAIWDNAIQTSKSAKDRLDRHMAELSGMIQKAESNLEQVTQAVQEQRQKIREE